MYKKRKGTFIKSVLIGLTTFLIMNGLAIVLDKFGVEVKWSTLIALIVGLLYNFLMQFRLYIIRSKNSLPYMIFTYMITDLMIILGYQYLFTKGVDDEKTLKEYLPTSLQDYYVEILRVLVGVLVWVVLSYPLRKFWVFA